MATLHSQLSIKVTNGLHVKLKEAAALKGITVGAAVRRILEEHFDEPGKRSEGLSSRA